MEPVLFYGVPQGCSFGSIVALEWLAQPYRLCRIVMPDDMQGPLYARINPVRETPVLLTSDGRTLSESAAILQHLVTQDPQQRLGYRAGSAEADRLNQTMSWLTTTFFASFSPLWTAYEMPDDPPVQAMLRTLGRSQVAKAHAQLDSLLGSNDWLVGDKRTIADAYFAGLARWADYHQAIDQSDYPNLARHVRKLEADPGVVFAHAIETEKPAVSSGGFRGHVTLAELEPRLAA
jgi:glutathione S-transferase